MWHVYGIGEVQAKFSRINLKKRGHFEDLSGYEKII
jgi:hypothetical protein